MRIGGGAVPQVSLLPYVRGEETKLAKFTSGVESWQVCDGLSFILSSSD